MACAASVQSALTKVGGVKSATIDLKAGEVRVRFDPARVKPEDMAKSVTTRGFESHVKKPKN